MGRGADTESETGMEEESGGVVGEGAEVREGVGLVWLVRGGLG